jgi:hypothetical protein
MKEINFGDLQVGDLFTNCHDDLMILTARVDKGLARANLVNVDGTGCWRDILGLLGPYTLVYRPPRKPVPGDIYRLESELWVVGPENTVTFLGNTDDKFIPGSHQGYPARGMGILKKTNGLLKDECELVGNMTELLMGLL